MLLRACVRLLTVLTMLTMIYLFEKDVRLPEHRALAIAETAILGPRKALARRSQNCMRSLTCMMSDSMRRSVLWPKAAQCAEQRAAPHGKQPPRCRNSDPVQPRPFPGQKRSIPGFCFRASEKIFSYLQ